MRTSQTLRVAALTAMILALVIVVPSTRIEAQSSDVLYHGVDLWVTPDDGNTLVSFEDDPLPADFFCQGSEPFMEIVPLIGGSLATSIPADWQVDTIVLRPDDVAFCDSDTVSIPVRVAALSLVSLDQIPIDPCGEYTVEVVLDGPQPTTALEVTRIDDSGGVASGALEINAAVRFVPVLSSTAEERRVNLNLSFLAYSEIPWTFEGDAAYEDPIAVDTDGDDVFDLTLPGTSNFFVGIDPEHGSYRPTCYCDPGPWNLAQWYCPCRVIHCVFPPWVPIDPIIIEPCELLYPTLDGQVTNPDQTGS